MRPLNIPVILGTTRKERASAPVARFMTGRLERRTGVITELIDIAALPLPVDDAGEAIKDPGFAAKMTAADGLVIVTPEYNHSFPGLLKHVLDSCLSEYIHKAVGIVGVSAGPFAGTRVVQSLLPVMREIGLVTIFWDINVGHVDKAFSSGGELVDEAYARRSDKFIRELIWMSKVLRHGREEVMIDEEAAETRSPVMCEACGTAMTHHAEKLDAASGGTAVVEMYQCAGCGAQQERLAPAL